MQHFSYHTHTNTFDVYDGHYSIEEMIKAAEQAGYTELGISNHFIYHPNIFKGCQASANDKMFHNDYGEALDIYKRTIDEIHRIAANSKIKVYAGFEVDFFPSSQWRDSFEKMIAEIKPDYLIGSTHYLRTADESIMCNMYYLSQTDITRHQAEELLVNYWQNIIEAIKSGYFAFIAHLDVCKLFNLGVDPVWDEWKRKVINTLSKYNHPFELNTSGWTKVGEQHPHLWMLEELAQRQVPIVISDDAHKIKHIAQHFEQAENLLKSINYSNRWKLNK